MQVLQARLCVSKFLIGGVRAAGSSLSSASLFTYTQFDALQQQLIAAIGPLTPGYCNALTSYQTRRYHRTINQLQESSIQITISSI